MTGFAQVASWLVLLLGAFLLFRLLRSSSLPPLPLSFLSPRHWVALASVLVASILELSSTFYIALHLSLASPPELILSLLQLFFWLVACAQLFLLYRNGLPLSPSIISFFALQSIAVGLRLEGSLALPLERQPVAQALGGLLLTLSLLLSLLALVANDPPERPALPSLEEEGALLVQPDTSAPAAPSPPPAVEEGANLFSRLTYWWYTPLLQLGYERALQHSDLPPLPHEEKAENIAATFHAHWEEQLASASPSLLKAIWLSVRASFIGAGLLKLLGNDTLIFAGPMLLSRIVSFLSSPDAPMWEGFLYAFLLLFTSVIQSLCINKYFHMVFRVNMRIKASTVAAVYAKALRLSHSARQGSTTGEIVNLQSLDANRLGETVTYLHNLWSAPLQIAVALTLLYQQLGWAAFAGLGVMIVSTPIQIYMGRQMAAAQKDMMSQKDKRQKVMNELLQGIRVLKFFAWESAWANKVQGVRNEELSVLGRSYRWRVSMGFLWSFMPVLVSLTAFALFTLSGKTLTAAIAFTSLSLFNVMRFPLNVLPMVLTSLIEARVSLQRLQTFLQSAELDPSAVERPTDSGPAIELEDAAFAWNETAPRLGPLSLRIPKGALVTVVGEVGSGKSSLLQAMLGEMPKTQGRLVVRGKAAYVAQQAWIAHASVKDNILFGLPYEPSRYQEIVKVCELRSDFAMLPGGDATEIGEKGINLSGGQKQRVALARALYAQADIYLLDDPLSAVDAHVGKALFQNAIKGVLAGKTRILVTHQLPVVPQCDLVLVFSEGRLVEVGSPQQLIQAQQGFARLLQKHVQHDQQEEKHEEKEEEKKEEKKDEKKKEGSTLMSAEERDTGEIKARVYWDYIRSLGPLPFPFFLMLLYIASSSLGISSNYWLSYWSAQVAAASNTTVPSNASFTPTALTPSYTLTPSSLPSIVSPSFLAVSLPSLPQETGALGVYYYLLIYAAMGLGQALTLVSAMGLLTVGGMKAARELHDRMLWRVLRAPVSFFDTTPMGRILNRFSKDQYTLDEALVQVISQAINTTLGVVAVLVVIGTVTPPFLLVVLPLAFLYRFIQRLYLRSSREVQRLESVSKSPVFSLFAETLSGLPTLRAFLRQKGLLEHNYALQDSNLRAVYSTVIANRWLALRLEFLGACVVFGAAFFAVSNRSNIVAGLAGLSLSYALQLTSSLNWLVRMSTEVENNLVSAERVLQYTQIAQEAPPTSHKAPAPSWPSQGAIRFEDLELRYRPGLPLILKGISADIKPKEKIGVVGRTGAGKSSLMLALFRLVEPASGRVIIDGIDIASIGLDELRSRLAIIPQDPTLFTGTIRTNLDPFEERTDEEVWRALDAVSLKAKISSLEGQLLAPVTESGDNLSVGTRQLLCLARALLRRAKILVLDEATASVDFETDAVLQATIRREFVDATTITIAHRIVTILDSDRVMVLDQGQLVEFAPPKQLLQSPGSLFASLAKQGGAIATSPILEREEPSK